MMAEGRREAAAIVAAERVARRRARLFPLLGIALIVANALFSDNGGIFARFAWLALFAGGLVLVLTGGPRSRALRGLIDDETTRAHRSTALWIGYVAAVACTGGLYITTAYEVIDVRQALQIVLATAIAAPLISFGAQERRALGDD